MHGFRYCRLPVACEQRCENYTLATMNRPTEGVLLPRMTALTVVFQERRCSQAGPTHKLS